ncbi:hypothetical protein RhiJN_12083 [Ceratobasidium sp. AG-Ba]|nr:hypothetical protein RhiJN_12083 [Ceratobasidium sp. AG-Ba]
MDNTTASPPVELTNAEPNVIPVDLVSSTSSTLDALASAPPLAYRTSSIGSELIHVQTGLPWWASIILLTAIVRSAVLPLNLTLMGTPVDLCEYSLSLLRSPKKSNALVKLEIAPHYSTPDSRPKTDGGGERESVQVAWPPSKCQLPCLLLRNPNLCNANWLRYNMEDSGGSPTDCGRPNLGLASDESAAMIFYRGMHPLLFELSYSDRFFAYRRAQSRQPRPPPASHTRNFFRALAVITIPVVSYLPSGVLIYFITNGAFMLVQTGLSKIPAVRRRYGILDKPAPLPGVKPDAPPTFMDSLRALKKQAQEAQARARAAQKRR